MSELIMDLMKEGKNVSFILSQETALEVANAMLDDGLIFEGKKVAEIYKTVDESVAVVITQLLTKDGYIYIIEDYLTFTGSAKIIETEVVFIDDEIEDLVDFDRLNSDRKMIISSESGKEETCECYDDGFQDGLKTGIELVRDMLNDLLEEV